MTQRPRVGRVDFGDLRRLSPVSADWGFDRGTPVDRFYIDRFMRDCADDVRGTDRVLAIVIARMTRLRERLEAGGMRQETIKGSVVRFARRIAK